RSGSRPPRAGWLLVVGAAPGFGSGGFTVGKGRGSRAGGVAPGAWAGSRSAASKAARNPKAARANFDRLAGWAKPTGPALGGPDDKLRVPTKRRGLVGTAPKSAPLPTLRRLQAARARSNMSVTDARSIMSPSPRARAAPPRRRTRP